MMGVVAGLYPYPALPPELSPGGANNMLVPPGFPNMPPGMPYGRGVPGFVSNWRSLITGDVSDT